MTRYTVDQLRRIAAQRELLHRTHASSRPLSPDYEFIGVCGEAAFAEMTGLDLDELARPDGDHGADFRTPLGTIDVKTARKPYNLLREAGKPAADILVLAEYNPTTETARCVGWMYDWEVVQSTPKDFGYGILNYYRPRTSLRPIAELCQLITWSRGG